MISKVSDKIFHFRNKSMLRHHGINFRRRKKNYELLNPKQPKCLSLPVTSFHEFRDSTMALKPLAIADHDGYTSRVGYEYC